MDVPGPPVPSAHSTRAPASGLKLMIAILIVFALLAAYGQWERSRRSKIETSTIIPAPDVSPRPSPDHRD